MLLWVGDLGAETRTQVGRNCAKNPRWALQRGIDKYQLPEVEINFVAYSNHKRSRRLQGHRAGRETGDELWTGDELEKTQDK